MDLSLFDEEATLAWLFHLPEEKVRRDQCLLSTTLGLSTQALCPLADGA